MAVNSPLEAGIRFCLGLPGLSLSIVSEKFKILKRTSRVRVSNPGPFTPEAQNHAPTTRARESFCTADLHAMQ